LENWKQKLEKSLGQDLNDGHPKYKGGELAHTLTCLVLAIQNNVASVIFAKVNKQLFFEKGMQIRL
jgi:hypothetical protein